jgi:hypothetical protein
VSLPPYLNKTFYSVDFFTDPFYREKTTAAMEVFDVVFSRIDLDPRIFDLIFGDEIHSTVHEHPHTLAAAAVRDGLDSGKVVGYLFGVIAWDKYVQGT